MVMEIGRPNDRALSSVERTMALADESDTINVLKGLFPEDETVWMLTQIDGELIIPIVALATQCEVTGSPVLKKYLKNLLKILISKDRKGRLEYLRAVEITKNMEEEDNG